jgi:hypothetical protein
MLVNYILFTASNVIFLICGYYFGTRSAKPSVPDEKAKVKEEDKQNLFTQIKYALTGDEEAFVPEEGDNNA